MDADGRTFEDELSVWVVFPDRARWQRKPPPDQVGGRELHFRYGPQTWVVAPGSAQSTRVQGAAAREIEFEFELRRALWLWPEGFEWSGEGGFRSAPVSTPSLDGDERWFLVARLGAEGRPAEMGVAQGSPEADPRSIVHVRGLTWRDSAGRFVPAEFDLHHGETRAWHEQVRASYPSPFALEHFFLPPDRKQPDLPVTETAPREVRLAERAERRLGLDGGEDWAAALEAGRSLAKRERERLSGTGRELAPWILVELDHEGRPRAVRVELSELPSELPEGWVRAPEQAAWDQRLPTTGPISARQVTLLRGRLRPSERADWPFVRVAPDPQGTLRAVLVQPFEREFH